MSKKLLWIDLEMTGLDEKIDTILEVAVVITDYDLVKQAEFSWVIHQSEEVLQNMNDWCKKHHGDSGLTARVRESTDTIEKIDQELETLTLKHFGKKSGKEGAVLAGNSIHNDRRFIDKYLPRFSSQLHYRMVDVSSFKEVFKEKYGIKVEKKNTHRAIDDIHESVEELKKYLAYISIPTGQ